MPELPEVETLRLDLGRALRGATITRVRLSRVAPLETSRREAHRVLPGRRILDVRRRGKFLLFHLDADWRLVLHLGMTGRLSLVPLPPAERDHVHMVLSFRPARGRQEARLLFRDPRRFGRIRLHRVLEGREPLSHLGPEPLEIGRRAFVSLFEGRRAPIKSLLLDQGVLAGLGNIYADEALFRAGLHPATPAGRIDAGRLGALRREIRRVLSSALRHRGTTLRDYRDGRGGEGGFRALHRVYGRAGEPCPKCGASIRRMLLSNRSAHFCPGCQGEEAAQKPGSPRSHRRPATPRRSVPETKKARADVSSARAARHAR